MSRDELNRLEVLISGRCLTLKYVPDDFQVNPSPTGRRPLIYLAGPFGEVDPTGNTHRMMRIWDGLLSLGIAAFCPHWSLSQHVAFPRTRREWLDFDLVVLDHCDAVLRCSGESAGAAAEVERALISGLTVCYSLSALLVTCELMRVSPSP